MVRRVNAVTKPDRHPLPNLSDSVYGLHGMKYFSSMDLERGYYQLKLDKASREVTAFPTQNELWQFKRIPFGLRDAPSAFQRAMQYIFAGFFRTHVVVYIDDVLIMTKTVEEHIMLVSRVLQTLAAHGVKIKKKCAWFQEEVEFLGHVVGVSCLRKSPAFMEKVKDFPKPRTTKELREFLGLANFQRKFVSDRKSVV
jgi:hypothetical protein